MIENGVRFCRGLEALFRLHQWPTVGLFPVFRHLRMNSRIAEGEPLVCNRWPIAWRKLTYHRAKAHLSYWVLYCTDVQLVVNLILKAIFQPYNLCLVFKKKCNYYQNFQRICSSKSVIDDAFICWSPDDMWSRSKYFVLPHFMMSIRWRLKSARANRL